MNLCKLDEIVWMPKLCVCTTKGISQTDDHNVQGDRKFGWLRRGEGGCCGQNFSCTKNFKNKFSFCLLSIRND